jgi:hypothetical protein
METYPERVLGTTTGLTETKSDSCDANGDLVQHRCEILPSTDCAPCAGECPSCVEHTGRLIAVPFDCGGGCSAGVCDSWCPEPSDILNFETGSDSTLVVENETSGRRYSCIPHPDGESGCFDLTRYVSGQPFDVSTVCYGDVLVSFPLPWSPDEPWNGMTRCYVDCTLLPP